MPEAATSAQDGIGTSGRGARGGGVVLLGSGAALVIQLLSLVVFSRLLSPADFGLVAMVTVFVALGNLLRDFGLPMAGLQASTLSHQQASNLFWMNIAVASVAAGALAAATPALVAIYNEPRLASMVPIFAIVVLLGGASSQLQVNLARRMRFGTLVTTDIAAQLMALAAAIALAWAGAGYWALVAQAVMTAGATLALRWFASGWRPAFFRRGHGAGGMLQTGAYFGVAQLLTFFQSNVDTLVIGARLGATQLGYYNRAYQLLTVPAGRLLDPLTQVVVTALNEAAARGQDRGRLLLTIQFGVGALVVWVFATAAGVAQFLIPVVLGDSWNPVVPVFQVLAIGGCVWVFNHVSYWAFIVYDGAVHLLRYNLVSKPFAIICILIGSRWGIVGVAWGYVIAMVFSWPLNLAWLQRTSPVRADRFFINGALIILCGAAAGAAAFGVSNLIGDVASIGAVLAGSALSAAVMVVCLCALPPTRRPLASWARYLNSNLSLQRGRRA